MRLAAEEQLYTDRVRVPSRRHALDKLYFDALRSVRRVKLNRLKQVPPSFRLLVDGEALPRERACIRGDRPLSAALRALRRVTHRLCSSGDFYHRYAICCTRSSRVTTVLLDKRGRQLLRYDVVRPVELLYLLRSVDLD